MYCISVLLENTVKEFLQYMGPLSEVIRVLALWFFFPITSCCEQEVLHFMCNKLKLNKCRRFL